MQFTIISETPGRLRVRLGGRVPDADVGALYAALTSQYGTQAADCWEYASGSAAGVVVGDAAEDEGFDGTTSNQELCCDNSDSSSEGNDGDSVSNAIIIAQDAEKCAASAVAVRIYPAAGSVTVCYGPAVSRDAVLERLGSINSETIEQHRGSSAALVPRQGSSLGFQILWQVAGFVLRRLVLAAPFSTAWAFFSFIPFALAALSSLKRGRLGVPVLDAASVIASFIQNDISGAGQTMLLLNLGETLEEHTRKRSENELIGALLERSPRVVLVSGNEEKEVGSNEVLPGNIVVVRTGLPVNVDGEVVEGSAWVNQAALTGEPYAIERTAGDSVFAGTVVETGEIFVRARVSDEDTRLRAITSLVQRSEAIKSEQQMHMEQAAERIVPWNFALAAITGIITRDFTRASAALMVDYSCILKMGGSIAVLGAMRDGAKAGFTVKGARYFESYATADTLVFDKTGTLTHAKPVLRSVLAFTDAYNEREVLRLAACLEEHFPHPLARAVVRAAEHRGIDHRERHAKVEYIVAHGIASSLDGARVVIGSKHFVMQDEGVPLDDSLADMLDIAMVGLTPLYLAVDGALVGVLGIEDPLKEDVRQTLERLRGMGFKRIIMLTGDNARSAERIAEEAGIEEFHADLLPDDKHRFIEQLKGECAGVVMVGDGVNDSPALACADVGIALGQGTAIAREVADITFVDDDLEALCTLRELSWELKRRLDFTSRSAICFNSAVMGAGLLGILTPSTASLLHNSSTVALCIRNSRPYLEG